VKPQIITEQSEAAYAALAVDFGFLCDLRGSASAKSAVKGFYHDRGNQKLYTAENAKEKPPSPQRRANSK
jgi:hypothetical protein